MITPSEAVPDRWQTQEDRTDGAVGGSTPRPLRDPRASRARDTKLGPEVAIKVLPAEVAQDSERLARFQRAATLLAALNHPHIAAIYGLEADGGNPFLVLELVEGEDLAQRLERGPIPVGEALEIARQIAEALEEAHEKGIIHRDLKPANVKVTPGGAVPPYSSLV